MSDKIKRYTKAFEAALLVKQKRQEIDSLLTEIAESLTMAELSSRHFCINSAQAAIWPIIECAEVSLWPPYTHADFGSVGIQIYGDQPESDGHKWLMAALDGITNEELMAATGAKQ